MSVRKRSTLLGKVLVALKYISLILITLVCLAPIILAIVTSLKSKAEVYDLGVLQLPERLHFENYVTAFVDGNMLNGFISEVYHTKICCMQLQVRGYIMAASRNIRCICCVQVLILLEMLLYFTIILGEPINGDTFLKQKNMMSMT